MCVITGSSGTRYIHVSLDMLCVLLPTSDSYIDDDKVEMAQTVPLFTN